MTKQTHQLWLHHQLQQPISSRRKAGLAKQLPQHKPWMIIHYLPHAQHRCLGRYFNRQDADRHLQFLQRALPMQHFAIAFDYETRNGNKT